VIGPYNSVSIAGSISIVMGNGLWRLMGRFVDGFDDLAECGVCVGKAE